MLCALPQKSGQRTESQSTLLYCLKVQDKGLELDITIAYAATANFFKVRKHLYHLFYVISPINYFSKYFYQARCVFVLAIIIRLLAPLCYGITWKSLLFSCNYTEFNRTAAEATEDFQSLGNVMSSVNFDHVLFHRHETFWLSHKSMYAYIY